MTKYQNILVALDLKPEDDNIVSEQAKALAQSYGAQMSIVHIVEPIYNYGIPPGTENKFDEWQNEIETTAKEKLTKIGEKLSIPTERQHLSVGQIKRGILNIANQINSDLIIVGSHARHGLSALIMGDTADDMLHNANCDVLAVHIPPKK